MPVHVRSLLFAVSICLLIVAAGFAQSPSSEIQFENAKTQRWRIGVIVTARGTTTGIEATLPVPMDWPEQKVSIVDQQLSFNVRPVRYRTLNGGVRQMVVSIPRLSAGENAEALITFEVVKRHILAPQSTDQLRVPALSSKLRPYVLPSPSIESNDPRIKELGKKIVAADSPAWRQVETIFDWVRDNVEYKFDPQLRGALVALDKRIGDCEEMTSLFVALCRVNKIPARSVWIPGHCYPEFYLQDATGRGHWYPCQAAGSRAFGAMPESRPILQKGDSFRLPGSRKPLRYVSETLRARNAAAAPQVEWVRKVVK